MNKDFDVQAYCENLAKAGTEHAHQRALFGWLNYAAATGAMPLAGLAFAIPNGGKRDAITAARLKAEGVKPGVPDVCYPVRGPLQQTSLWLELKKPESGVLSGEQLSWHAALREQGAAVATCWGWQAARRAFVEYTMGMAMVERYR